MVNNFVEKKEFMVGFSSKGLTMDPDNNKTAHAKALSNS